MRRYFKGQPGTLVWNARMSPKFVAERAVQCGRCRRWHLAERDHDCAPPEAHAMSRPAATLRG